MKKIVLILLLSSVSFFAQDEVSVDLSNPNATIYTHIYYLQDENRFFNKTTLAK